MGDSISAGVLQRHFKDVAVRVTAHVPEMLAVLGSALSALTFLRSSDSFSSAGETVEPQRHFRLGLSILPLIRNVLSLAHVTCRPGS